MDKEIKIPKEEFKDFLDNVQMRYLKSNLSNMLIAYLKYHGPVGLPLNFFDLLEDYEVLIQFLDVLEEIQIIGK